MPSCVYLGLKGKELDGPPHPPAPAARSLGMISL